jgi:hypothetical protein
MTVDGESLPPLRIAVGRQWYRGEYGSVKAKSRRRNLPVASVLKGVLEQIKSTADDLQRRRAVLDHWRRDCCPSLLRASQV